jgi:hypothetical protein
VLGELLEIAITAEPLVEALEFYTTLGFLSLPVGDSPLAPNAALSNGSVTLGLHATSTGGPVPTFVRPGLKAHLRPLRRAGVDFDLVEVADDAFHRASFVDPSGQRALLVEARTFSPAVPDPQRVSALGTFHELSVSTHSADASARFWAGLGFEILAEGDEPRPWCRVAGHGLVLGFHEGSNFGAALAFTGAGLDARLEYLAALGLHAKRDAPIAASGERTATLLGPGGTPIYLLEAPR